MHLALLGCESRPPYGPLDHTAGLLADLLALAAQKAGHACRIRIKIYNAQRGEYPSQWDVYDGILLPGSLSSAYDNDAWIVQLKEVIQTQIVAVEKPTLAVCFGHQILAHSFADGRAVPTPTGPRAGRYATALTAKGQELLLGNNSGDSNSKTSLDLYYTHGDMVARLPESAVPLMASSGDARLPVLAAAYYGRDSNSIHNRKPYAVSFQAHPEYATSLDLGLYRTFDWCCTAMQERHPHLDLSQSKEDAHRSFELVQKDSVDAIVAVARLLGWFPEEE